MRVRIDVRHIILPSFPRLPIAGVSFLFFDTSDTTLCVCGFDQRMFGFFISPSCRVGEYAVEYGLAYPPAVRGGVSAIISDFERLHYY